jgi:hypothetical protein
MQQAIYEHYIFTQAQELLVDGGFCLPQCCTQEAQDYPP